MHGRPWVCGHFLPYGFFVSCEVNTASLLHAEAYIQGRPKPQAPIDFFLGYEVNIALCYMQKYTHRAAGV